jgi:hypothetical protein
MVSEAPDMPRIIARLPFIPADSKKKIGPEALVICSVRQEESGRDHSFLGINAEEDVGFGAIDKALSQVGVSAVFNQLWHDPNPPAAWIYLVEVDDFLDSDGPGMRHLKDGLGPHIKSVVHLGGYAMPLNKADLETDTLSDSTPEQGS